MIITFCNREYAPLAQHWVEGIKKLGNAYIVVATDKDTKEYLEARDIKVALNEFKGGSFWKYRMAVLNEFLQHGIGFIHSDLDAFWKKNVELDFNKADMWFSQGTVSPRTYVEKHGFVLCCGLFGVKANEKTQKFFQHYLDTFDEKQEDQTNINNLLIDTEWKKPEGKSAISQRPYKYFETEIYGYNKEFDLTIGLISMLKVQREKYTEDGDIYHLLSSKNLDAKLKVLERI